jgi:hypothetical protein
MSADDDRDIVEEAQRIIRRRRIFRSILCLIVVYLIVWATGWIWDIQVPGLMPHP